MSARAMGAALVVLAVLALVPPATAQQQGRPPGQEPDTTELVFQREVFGYPTYERRNPFRSLVGSDEGGPRFEELRLLGIIYSGDSGQSVALLAASGASGGGQQGGALSRTYRVRQGQTLGNTRVLDIQRSEVIVEVTEFGLTERRVIELQRPAEGGSS